MFVFRNLYLLERCILYVYQRKQTGFKMNLAIKPHFSQNINLHLTQTQYGWPMRWGWGMKPPTPEPLTEIAS